METKKRGHACCLPTLRVACLLGVVCMTTPAVSAGWSAADLDRLKQQFVSGIAGKYEVAEYPWAFFDLEGCFEPGHTCGGANSESPYGYIQFYQKRLPYAWMDDTDALVLIMEAPPPMRYFGVTPYIYTRCYESLPTNPGEAGKVQVFASLGDSVNLTNIATTGSATRGENVFGQLAAFVVTADRLSQTQITNQFLSLGFPDHAINQIVLPINAVPLKMGTTLNSDTFSLLLRLAYPYEPAQMREYTDRAPIRALLLSPVQARPGYAMRRQTPKVPGSGAEPCELEAARDDLFQELHERYKDSYEPTESAVNLTQTYNYFCVWLGRPCRGDNPDAIYSEDLGRFVPKSREDKILIVGVNHVDLGKALYISHVITSQEHDAGVAGANDDRLRGTALRAAGITDPHDPRYDIYSNLYALTISYDCTGELDCLTIPEPTSADKVGIEFGKELNIHARYYVDPATGTRPDIDEVIPHRVLVLTKRPAAR